MSGGREGASPDYVTKQRLFSSSGGYCQNPSCHEPLFQPTGSKVVNIAELAHVIAASADGPRPPGGMPVEDRASFDNLIVLCVRCHTKIDKAEADFPIELLRQWKASHIAALNKTFGAQKLPARADVRMAIEPLLAQNRALFDDLNPDLPYGENPESEMAAKWQSAMKRWIFPNNQRILAYLDVNREHLDEDEKKIVEEFRQHVEDLGMRHLTDTAPVEQKRFPISIEKILMEN